MSWWDGVEAVLAAVGCLVGVVFALAVIIGGDPVRDTEDSR